MACGKRMRRIGVMIYVGCYSPPLARAATLTGTIGGAVAGVAVLAAIGVGAYVYMRSKDSADSTQLAEVQLVGSADEAALPKAVASAPPLMPPPPPTGRNFCSNCGAPLQGQFCAQCGARA